MDIFVRMIICARLEEILHLESSFQLNEMRDERSIQEIKCSALMAACSLNIAMEEDSQGIVS